MWRVYGLSVGILCLLGVHLYINRTDAPMLDHEVTAESQLDEGHTPQAPPEERAEPPHLPAGRYTVEVTVRGSVGHHTEPQTTTTIRSKVQVARHPANQLFYIYELEADIEQSGSRTTYAGEELQGQYLRQQLKDDHLLTETTSTKPFSPIGSNLLLTLSTAWPVLPTALDHNTTTSRQDIYGAAQWVWTPQPDASGIRLTGRSRSLANPSNQGASIQGHWQRDGFWNVTFHDTLPLPALIRSHEGIQLITNGQVLSRIEFSTVWRLDLQEEANSLPHGTSWVQVRPAMAPNASSSPAPQNLDDILVEKNLTSSERLVQLKRWVDQHEDIEVLIQRLRTTSNGSELWRDILGALAMADHVRGKHGLLSYLRTVEPTQAPRIVPLLAQGTSWDDQVEDFLRQTAESSEGSLQRATLLTIGSAAHELTEEHDAAKTRLADYLWSRLSESTSAEQAKTLLNALGNTGDPAALDRLQPWLHHQDPEVRARAVFALRNIDNGAAATLAQELFNDRDAEVRRKAFQFFQHVSPDAAAIDRMLTAYRKETDPRARTTIQRILEQHKEQFASIKDYMDKL